MQHAALRSQELNPAKLATLFRKQFQLCNVKGGETIAVVSDLGTRREYVQSAFAAADELGADIYEMCVNSMPSWTKVGVPTIGKCKGTLEAAMQADMIVIFHVPLFSKWLKDVRDVGTRVLMVIDAPDELEQLMAPAGLKEAVLHAHLKLEKTHEIRVVSEAGTDFTYKCGEFPVMSQYGFAETRGRFDHWGAGHVHTFPNEGTANLLCFDVERARRVVERIREEIGSLKLMVKAAYFRDEERLRTVTCITDMPGNCGGGMKFSLRETVLEDCRLGGCRTGRVDRSAGCDGVRVRHL